MISKDQILATLKQLGPSSPKAIANSMHAEPSAIGYHLRNMLEAKAVKASGTSNNRVYALPDQKIEAAPPAPPPGPQESEEQRQARQVEAQPRAPAARRRAALPPSHHRGLAPGHRPGRAGPGHLHPRADAGDRRSAAHSLRGLTW